MSENETEAKPLIGDELAFWERVFIAVGAAQPVTACLCADRAVKERRARLPQRSTVVPATSEPPLQRGADGTLVVVPAFPRGATVRTDTGAILIASGEVLASGAEEFIDADNGDAEYVFDTTELKRVSPRLHLGRLYRLGDSEVVYAGRDTDDGWCRVWLVGAGLAWDYAKKDELLVCEAEIARLING